MNFQTISEAQNYTFKCHLLFLVWPTIWFIKLQSEWHFSDSSTARGTEPAFINKVTNTKWRDSIITSFRIITHHMKRLKEELSSLWLSCVKINVHVKWCGINQTGFSHLEPIIWGGESDAECAAHSICVPHKRPGSRKAVHTNIQLPQDRTETHMTWQTRWHQQETGVLENSNNIFQCLRSNEHFLWVHWPGLCRTQTPCRSTCTAGCVWDTRTGCAGTVADASSLPHTYSHSKHSLEDTHPGGSVEINKGCY